MIIKIAGAGAGKTTALAGHIIAKRLELPPSKIIYCITFTNSAVSRISEKLKEYYTTVPENIQVSTIHSFLYQDIIKPYYYLLYGKQYLKISSIELSSKVAFRNIKIRELEDKDVLHVSKFTERAKWVIYKKTSDNKIIKDKRKVFFNNFSKYCGQIYIDEAQDMDKNMAEIVKTFNRLSVPIELIGDPKQDLKGYGTLRELSYSFIESTDHIINCYRCPQNHLRVSNLIVPDSEKQHSEKPNGALNIYFESETDVKQLIAKRNFDLIYISSKNDRYETKEKKQNNYQIEGLCYEIEQLIIASDLTEEKSTLQIKQETYFLACEMINEYYDTKNSDVIMKKLGQKYWMKPKTYAKIKQSLEFNDKGSDNKISVSSIDRVKGQEGQNCFFILTKDLAPYLFGDKREDNKTKNKLYVALTRSLERLSILVSEEVEQMYSKQEILDFFEPFF